jgi:hypothetical protein
VISGRPAEVLLWLWRRSTGGVAEEGDPQQIKQLQLLMREATQ